MTGGGATGSDGAGLGVLLAWSSCAVWTGCAWDCAFLRCCVGWPCWAVTGAVASEPGRPDDGTEEDGAVEFCPADDAAGTAEAGVEGSLGDVDGPGLDGAGAGDAVDVGAGLAGEGVSDGAGAGSDGAGAGDDVGAGDDGGLGVFTGPGDCTGPGE